MIQVDLVGFSMQVANAFGIPWPLSVDREVSEARQLILWCGHDWSLTGAEGSVLELGRHPILWTCDTCGATVLDI